MYDYSKIPAELKTQKAWVNVWNGSKIPMKTTERKAASSTNTDTWGEFEQAVQNVSDGVYDGIGYVFHNTELVGIDIDDGFNNGLLNALACDIMKHCQSYTEKSRSGRGIHILLKGRLPFKGKNNGEGVEIYGTGRYFIMTGKVLIFDEIIENQAAIDYVVATYFAEQAKVNNNTRGQKAYTPIYPRSYDRIIKLRPDYPEIKPGYRNNAMTSLAGQLHTQGYGKSEIYKELLIANQQACKPPLRTCEIEQIVKSITKYKRG